MILNKWTGSVHFPGRVDMKHRKPDDMGRIIAFVNDFYRDNRRSPSARQIASGTGIPAPRCSG